MFWGRTLKQGETLSLTKEAVHGALLHLSHLSLNPASKSGATTVFITQGEKKLALVTLEKEKRDFQTIDLYFSTGSDTSFSVLGSGEVNLLGYFEPADTDSDAVGATRAVEESESENEEEAVPQAIAEDDSSEEDSDDEEPLKPAQKPAVAAGQKATVEIDSDDEEESSSESDEDSVPVKSIKPANVPAPTKKPKLAPSKPLEHAEKPSLPHSGKPTKPQDGKSVKKPVSSK